MPLHSCPFKIGDLVVNKHADFILNHFSINKIVEIEYVDEFSDMWFDDLDEEPYWFFVTEVVYLKQSPNYHLEMGDTLCFEESEIVSLNNYFNKSYTLDDYIKFKNGNIDILED